MPEVTINIRNWSTRQSYWFNEIDTNTKPSDITMGVRCSYGDIVQIQPTDEAWLKCQLGGFGGYGLFEVPVCVAVDSWWEEKRYEFKLGNVLFYGSCIQEIQTQALVWLQENQDLKNVEFLHRFGRLIVPSLMRLKGYKPYVPKDKE